MQQRVTGCTETQFPCVSVHPVRETLYSLAGCFETDVRDVGASRNSGQLEALGPVPSPQTEQTCVSRHRSAAGRSQRTRTKWDVGGFSQAPELQSPNNNSYDSHLESICFSYSLTLTYEQTRSKGKNT